MQKKTIAAVAVAVAAAIAITVSLAVTLRPGRGAASTDDATRAAPTPAPTPARSAPEPSTAPFYYGVNIGMLNLFPLDKTPYRHTKPELQAMLAVGGGAYTILVALGSY
jgi:hypothetical protein